MDQLLKVLLKKPLSLKKILYISFIRRAFLLLLATVGLYLYPLTSRVLFMRTARSSQLANFLLAPTPAGRGH